MPNPFPIQFIDARIRDMDRIAELTVACWNPYESGEPPKSLSWNDVGYWYWKEGIGLFTAIDGIGEVQAVCGLSISRKGLHINFISVDPHVQRLKIGTQLLQHAVIAMRSNNKRKILTEFRKGNTEAAKFFRANGFQKTRGYYLNSGGHRIRMSRFIWNPKEREAPGCGQQQQDSGGR